MKLQPNCKPGLRVALPLALIVCLLCSVTAFAAPDTTENTDTQMTITYIKAEDPAPSSSPTYTPSTPTYTPSAPVYELAIPAELSLNSSNTVPIYLTENNLSEGRRLDVLIDCNTTEAHDGHIFLHGTKGQTANVKVGYYEENGYVQYIPDSGLCMVASFRRGDTRPFSYGTLVFTVENQSELVADTYTGTLNFQIFIYDD